jgi:hypothetical protein
MKKRDQQVGRPTGNGEARHAQHSWSSFGRHPAWPAIVADGDVGEDALGDRDLLVADAAPRAQLSTFTVIEVLPTLMISA